jgi:hypothetical protein
MKPSCLQFTVDFITNLHTAVTCKVNRCCPHHLCLWLVNALYFHWIHIMVLILYQLPAAFFLALGFGCTFSYYKIVQNEHYGYPEVRSLFGFPNVISRIMFSLSFMNRNGFQVSVPPLVTGIQREPYFKFS